MEKRNSPEYARTLDAADPLAALRSEFIIPQRDGRDQIYFLGNSLGLQPRRTAACLGEVLEQWGHWGVEGFFNGSTPWMQYHDRLTGPLAAVVGAKPSEVTVMNQLTVNLHLLLVSFYRPDGRRRKILCEAKAFPSDQYMLETHIRQRGLDPDEILVEVGPRPGAVQIEEEDIEAAIEQHGGELALVFLGGVNYYTGQVFDLERITAAAHKAGAKAGFDLAHAAGNVPLHLHRWNADFAAWCSYKYLNSGPGAVAGAFIHERYHAATLQRFGGWWGYEKETRFLMQKGFRPIRSAEGWQLSTPSPLLYAAHGAALELFAVAGMEALVQKGKALSGYVLELVQELCAAGAPIRVLTPERESARGCQVSLLMLQDGRKVFDALTRAGIFADWREPDVIRIAPVPLYNTFEEVWRFGQVLAEELNC
ncbi:MAG TPA: kynureninase [Chitinophagaceae bacterium]|jgi:kynureninase|nr:kynureninase [Chitinophagaceae bacterium]